MIRANPGEEEITLAHLGPGECFGEMALVSDNLRMATVRSCTSANVLTVDRDAFQSLFAHLPPLRGLFQQLIEQRTNAPVQR